MTPAPRSVIIYVAIGWLLVVACVVLAVAGR